MREIKFRALVKSTWGTRWEYYRIFDQPTWLEGDNEIIVKDLQFTGLLDKNGKEIWEGDIVKIWQCEREIAPQIVLWDEQEMGWSIGCSFNEYDLFEVIGNMCENPELIKENKK